MCDRVACLNANTFDFPEAEFCRVETNGPEVQMAMDPALLNAQLVLDVIHGQEGADKKSFPDQNRRDGDSAHRFRDERRDE